MDKRDQKLVLLCDNDADHSFTLEGELRNRDFEVVIITDATELLTSAKSLRPVAVLANPDMKGFNEYDVCKHLMNDMNIPVILLLDSQSTHRATLNSHSTHNAGECQADDVVTKPVREVDNLVNLIQKQMAWHQSNPSS
jgi:CheY-like chemotaxis protein